MLLIDAHRVCSVNHSFISSGPAAAKALFDDVEMALNMRSSANVHVWSNKKES